MSACGVSSIARGGSTGAGDAVTGGDSGVGGADGVIGMLCTSAKIATRHNARMAMKRMTSVCRSAAPPMSASTARFSG